MLGDIKAKQTWRYCIYIYSWNNVFFYQVSNLYCDHINTLNGYLEFNHSYLKVKVYNTVLIITRQEFEIA